MHERVYTSEDISGMDLTELADLVWECSVLLYRLTEREMDALRWVGGRYDTSATLLAAVEDVDGWPHVRIDPLDVAEVLRRDGVDRVPCLSDGTALQRIVWCIGPRGCEE